MDHNDYEKYNGYENRETWCFHLWITKSQELLKDAEQRIEGQEVEYAAESLKEFHREMWDDCMMQSGMYGEGQTFRDTLLMLQDVGSPWRINYYEVAEALLDV